MKTAEEWDKELYARIMETPEQRQAIILEIQKDAVRSEREACAQIADKFAATSEHSMHATKLMAEGAAKVAAAIRDRP